MRQYASLALGTCHRDDLEKPHMSPRRGARGHLRLPCLLLQNVHRNHSSIGNLAKKLSSGCPKTHFSTSRFVH